MANKQAQDAVQNIVRWETFIPDIAKRYIDTRMQIAKTVVDGVSDFEDPLSNEDILNQQLSSISLLIRFESTSISSSLHYLLEVLKQQIGQYRIMNEAAVADRNEETLKNLEIVETQLAWLVQIASAVIGSRQTYGSGYSYAYSTYISYTGGGVTGSDVDALDGALAAACFELVKGYQLGARQTDATSRLALAVISFMTKFRRAFLSEAISYVANPVIIKACGMQDQNEALFFIFAMCIFGMKKWGGTGNAQSGSKQGGNQLLGFQLSEGEGKGSQTAQDNEEDDRVINALLVLLKEMIEGYSTQKIILQFPQLDEIIRCHTVEYFPFLQTMTRHRFTYYTLMGQIVFSDTKSHLFDVFFAPFEQNLQFIDQMDQKQLSDPQFRRPLLGLFNDLRGLLWSCISSNVFKKQDSKVYCSLMKLWEEMTFSKGTRLGFDITSSNSVLLFRATAQMLHDTAQAYLGQGVIPSSSSLPSSSFSSAFSKFGIVDARALQDTIRAIIANIGESEISQIVDGKIPTSLPSTLRKEGLRINKILNEGNSGLMQIEREKEQQREREKGDNKKKRKMMKDDGAQTEQTVEKKLKKDIFETHYNRINRPIGHTLVAYTNCITGDYVPFGVCSFYKDDALQTSLTAALHLFVSVNNRDFQMFPKLSKRLILFIHGVFHHVVDVAMEAITPPQMVDVLEKILGALTSFNKDSTEFAIQTIDAILEYTYTHMSEIQSLIQSEEQQSSGSTGSSFSSTQLQQKAKIIKGMQTMNTVMTEHAYIFEELMQILFTFATRDDRLRYSATNALLPLIFIRNDFYLSIVHTLEEAVPIEDRDRLREAFTVQLMNDVPKDLNAKARAVFQSNLNNIIIDYKRLLS
ncbi:MAG: putative Nuclear transport receptor RanBP16 [Streblomastix strix]|uniref:Putative Nuclear transport receptor RanBP16 n=1 Tax=Streblomastix strix TaxID=222440 RepID=A0A5J4WFV7_9EUKA|nr:MAG: putative Nuclear transport receptor RanBP16 [Streblomastix strix]